MTRIKKEVSPSNSIVDLGNVTCTDERQDAAETGRNKLGIRKQFQKQSPQPILINQMEQMLVLNGGGVFP
ncbi:hypothetical protein PUN28_010450 [Cardiocondyla obscurior]|uniref:Uncharacterized protein n=1 Tax=Cardiocondyla obscurior TaxID=286306 RepID=A0AAW2FJS5_9HYME